jgi:hypothetical protein
MLETIIEVLKIMGWLGIILGILTFVNTICGIITNLDEGEKFSFRKLFKGLAKAIIFYISAVLTASAFTMLPFINSMITDIFSIELLSSDTLNTLSSIAILGIVIAAIIVQGKSALTNITRLANMSANVLIKEENDTNEEESEETEL